jgi:hypothetical protein
MQNPAYRYTEEVTSKRTTLLFAFLTCVFLFLLIYRLGQKPIDGLSILIGFFALMFTFFTINFRILSIWLSDRELKLRFGLFSWVVATANISDATIDHLPLIMQYGGAGIHFMLIRKRYRVSFNFLEHPRVVVALRKKVGLVKDISFSTRHPDEVIRKIQKAKDIHL